MQTSRQVETCLCYGVLVLVLRKVYAYLVLVKYLRQVEACLCCVVLVKFLRQVEACLCYFVLVKFLGQV